MTHTRAPWTLEERDHEPCQLIGNGTIHIADIYATDFPAGKADSLLIAAAPDLLEIVQMYRAAHCGKHRTETGDICVKCTQADEAIRKATGA